MLLSELSTRKYYLTTDMQVPHKYVKSGKVGSFGQHQVKVKLTFIHPNKKEHMETALIGQPMIKYCYSADMDYVPRLSNVKLEGICEVECQIKKFQIFDVSEDSIYVMDDYEDFIDIPRANIHGNIDRLTEVASDKVAHIKMMAWKMPHTCYPTLDYLMVE